MDLLNIQEQLNTEFSKSDTRIIFWFDDKGEYEDEVSEIQLDNAKLHILDGTNWFYSKWLLNESDVEGKYLVYAPFPKPNDAENPLADMYYYSVLYYTDRVSQMSQELGIDNRFKEHLAQYSNFWKNKNRIEKFKELGIDHFNVETIDIGLIAVLTDVKTPNFEEIIRQLLLNDNEAYLKALEDNGLIEKFWELCEKYFGYQSENPNMDDLAACMLLTYASVALKDTLPDVLKSYILKKKNDVVVFVRNLMDNVLYQEAYDVLSEKVDKTLRVVSRIRDELKKDADKAKDQSAQLLDIANCDAFRGLDGILIDWALDQLNDEILDAQIDGMNLAQIAEQRTAKSCHFGNVYKNEYQAIKYAYQMMKAVSVMEVTSDIKEMVADYQKQTYLIDSYYRWFYSAYDCMEDTERFAQVRERIENMYSFTYLQKVTPKWNQELTENLMADTGLKRQEDFYRNYLKAYEGKNRVIVIISDAFRYECAKELMERLELDEKCTPKLDCMISGLPSVTSVGMASLLPHKELLVDEKLNVTVDGQNCGDLASRDKILKAQNENNVALSFDEVASANKEKIRELLQKKNIVYIYHNQVDARGDKPASENEVFTACSEAIEEIHKLIKKLTGYISAAKFFVTADHGFLYKRDKLHEFDKVSYDREICAYSNKRFLLTTQKVNEPGMKSRMMEYMNQLYVTTPIGADIFKVAGGGQNYVHGGSSLQEMLIPVIELTTNTRAVAYDYVDVILTSVNRKVTNLITYFDFIQTEKVTDTMKARSLVAYFTTEDGEKISFDVPIVANSREDAPEKRTFHEKFTLKSREYKYGDKYYLVLADANDEKNILQQYEFMIDIAFVDDFGF
ncbi:BREX-1 system phosphatase PglZ type A [Lachnospiraceae bacterium AM23-2LB]|uniref:BREX-1 system phosphatase PglZ type A n=1 Tax=Mediterraneibacter glycyrrhizinilyticus TaxID=342942 RepID=UPI000E408EAF|nr:BREX-1 system phosphatase PglZ type A [Mediterraneibacter glycyrrhizinilyticus]MCB6308422.1 BREX-1 system phosphatase PglZ type A [Lachnospiraceae bacterium 210521-DFI.1.109]MCB6426925.1 BREX-1 system phosphatase PglZ type A [Mediterraneibacter glycyrrhizinilyticus]RGC74028.1 BREX-1 system phosphatase PglZ type A [Lachnospiraceae bacterium AM23-2LB]RJW02612.1 BREX-1 system phosphatase PglZ type A [Lachnospiraceae bacterium AM40-2BH]